MIAYATIAFNIISGLFYTPWMVKQIGDSDYGLYTLANSLINLFLFDFGLSAATSRFVSKYLAEGRQDKVDRILGAIYKLYFAIDAIFAVVFVALAVCLEQVYPNLSAVEVGRLRVVFILSAVFALANFPCVTFTGILNAYEKYISLKFADALYRIFSVVITVIALLCNGGLYALVSVHVAVGLLILGYKFYIIKKGTPVKVDFSAQEKGVYRELLGFSLWVTISTLAQRLIFGITPSVLGIVSTTTAIAVFGIVAVLENYIHLITTALNGMFMPHISRIYTQKDHAKKLNDLVIKVGRFQFGLNGLIVTGFLLLGKEFVGLWLGESYSAVYVGMLLISIPNLFYYSLQIANTAMVIQNQVRIQAVTNVAVGILNVALVFVLSKSYGVLGACVSISVVYCIRNIGYFIAYDVILALDIKRVFKECYLSLGAAMMITVMLGFCLNKLVEGNGWISFGIKVFAVGITYVVAVYAIGLQKQERQQLNAKIMGKFTQKK